MTNLNEVRERVLGILDLSMAGDDPKAHIEQDSLYLDVLRAIAEGHPQAKEMAFEAVKVEDIEFDRWYE